MNCKIIFIALFSIASALAIVQQQGNAVFSTEKRINVIERRQLDKNTTFTAFLYVCPLNSGCTYYSPLVEIPYADFSEIVALDELSESGKYVNITSDYWTDGYHETINITATSVFANGTFDEEGFLPYHYLVGSGSDLWIFELGFVVQDFRGDQTLQMLNFDFKWLDYGTEQDYSGYYEQLVVPDTEYAAFGTYLYDFESADMTEWSNSYFFSFDMEFLPKCGNGFVTDGEECDDMNNDKGDGCYHCKIDKFWECSDEPSSCSFVTPSDSLETHIRGGASLPFDLHTIAPFFKKETLDSLIVGSLNISSSPPHAFLETPSFDANKNSLNFKLNPSVRSKSGNRSTEVEVTVEYLKDSGEGEKFEYTQYKFNLCQIRFRAASGKFNHYSCHYVAATDSFISASYYPEKNSPEVSHDQYNYVPSTVLKEGDSQLDCLCKEVAPWNQVE